MDDAIAHFQDAVDVDPSSGDAQNNLGGALLEKGSADEAIPHFQRAAEGSTPGPPTQGNLGIAFLQKAKVDEALPHLQKAVALDPRQVRNQYYLGDAFYLQGKAPEALAHWREGLRLDANYLPLLSQMAWLLATSPQGSVRNGNEAVELARRAVQLSEGQDPVVLDTLGAAYAEAGRFADALDSARRALDLATRCGTRSGPLARTLRDRITLYEARIPYREKR